MEKSPVRNSRTGGQEWSSRTSISTATEYLDREEFQAAMIGVEEAVDNLMKTFDADSDGRITKQGV